MVKENKPNNNFGGSGKLMVRGASSNREFRSYLKFEVNGLSGCPESAALRVYSNDIDFNVNVKRVSDTSWQESVLTWSNQPIPDGSALDSQQALPTSWVEFDLGDAVQDNGTYSFVLTASDHHNLRGHFKPRQTSTPPELIVTEPDSCGGGGQQPDITNGMDLNQINAVIAQAAQGSTLYVESGTYFIGGKLQMKSDLILKALDVSDKPVFDARANPEHLIWQYTNASEINNTTFDGLEFHNIGFHLVNESSPHSLQNVTFTNCIFDYGTAITYKKELGNRYINLQWVDTAVIRDNTFLRRQGYEGRAIKANESNNVLIEGNVIGDVSQGAAWFVNGITARHKGNGGGLVIRQNSINRTPGWIDKDMEDHGIYIWMFDDVTINNNLISGWSPSASGGAIKARDGEGLLIDGNTMITSGVLLYDHDESTNTPLTNVIVSNNSISVSQYEQKIYNGIGYYPYVSVGPANYSFRIDKNTVHNGYIDFDHSRIIPSYFNANGGGVFNNRARGFGIDPAINQLNNQLIQ